MLAGTTEPLTGARVARLVHRGTPRGVQKALDRLVDQGIVHRQAAGRAYLHVLNRQHVAAPAVEALADLRVELLRRLRDEIAGWKLAPPHASLFGSVARGDGDAASDVDLLIVRPATVDVEDTMWRDQLDALATHVESWTGNHAAIIELDEAELRQRSRLVDDIRAEGIGLTGTPVRALVDDRR